MKAEEAGGLALMVGSVFGLVTMALHPTGVPLHGGSPERVSALLRAATAVHGLAIAGTVLSFYGFRELSRRLGADRALSSFAFASYALATVAVLCAAILSGLVFPSVFREALAETGPAKDALAALLHYTTWMNRAFAKVFVALAGAAIACWSVAGRRAGLFGRVLAAFGVAVGVVEVGAILSGAVSMSAHPFGIIVLGQAAWTIPAGARLYRSARTPVSADAP
jgi:hypothetical protein